MGQGHSSHRPSLRGQQALDQQALPGEGQTQKGARALGSSLPEGSCQPLSPQKLTGAPALKACTIGQNVYCIAMQLCTQCSAVYLQGLPFHHQSPGSLFYCLLSCHLLLVRKRV